MTQEEVQHLIQVAVEKAGGARKFSGKHDISEPYICNVLKGRAIPAKRICKAVGVEVVDQRTWKRVEK